MSATSPFSLGRLPGEQWEPTFDSNAVVDGRLRMLLPLRPRASSRDAADGAVVTWPLSALR